MNIFRYFSPIFLVLLWVGNSAVLAQNSNEDKAFAIVIHGGIGGTSQANEIAKKAVLNEALDAGYAILKDGGTAIEAVEAAIVVLEDSPNFNAGRGAVLNSLGEAELDASIMDGSNYNAGAVGGVTIVKNPIRAARAVMSLSPHVLLMGVGADSFAKEVGIEMVSRDYFITEEQRQRWLEFQSEGFNSNAPIDLHPGSNKYFGTVGAVALDQKGNIAAGTSTGGMPNKRFGRIGDSPIIGAGSYADNETCGISCTGHGEYFIRYAVASDISARMRYGGSTLDEAAREVVQERLLPIDARGGIIGIDANGKVVVEFNTPVMTRGWIDANGSRVVELRD
jgi:beta-aspartyl-peptidase (threonine type)